MIFGPATSPGHQPQPAARSGPETGSLTIRSVPDESGTAAPDHLPPTPGHVVSRPKLRAVITDWGGVMTNPISETINTWLAAEGIDRDSYVTIMRAWVSQAYDPDGPVNPIHALERGESTNDEFERLLAAQVTLADGAALPPAGLLNRMLAATVPDLGMYDVLRGIRRAGFLTAMLSNSWGSHDYPRDLFSELFDAVVISGEVGMRKPEERIFRHATGLLGLEPAECVFIDDIEGNIAAAEAIGMTGIHHQILDATIARLSELLAIPPDALQA
jgi:putative hydrolase of the HAD superfamily